VQRFGPPELCFPEVLSDLPGVICASLGAGKAIYFPWLPEWLYGRDSLPATRELVMGLLRRAMAPAPLLLEGAGPIEITLQHQGATGRHLLHLVNYTGQRNNLVEAPVAIHGLRIGIKRGLAGSPRALVSGATVASDGAVGDYDWYRLPPLGAFEALLFEPPDGRP
jgi:hypothetical protein